MGVDNRDRFGGSHARGTAENAYQTVVNKFATEANNPDVQAAAYYASEGALLQRQERQRRIEENPFGYIRHILDGLVSEGDESGVILAGRDRLDHAVDFWKHEIGERMRTAEKYRLNPPSLAAIASGVQAVYSGEPLVTKLVEDNKYKYLPSVRIVGPHEDPEGNTLIEPSEELLEQVFRAFGALTPEQSLVNQIEIRRSRTSLSNINEGNLIFPTDIPGVYLQYDERQTGANLLFPLKLISS